MIIDQSTYLNFKENSIQGRYVVNEQIATFLEGLNSKFKVEIVGTSVEERPISGATVGSGNHKVLIWSQMHGNESTTTKAVLDLLRFLESGDSLASSFLEICTLKIIPI